MLHCEERMYFCSDRRYDQQPFSTSPFIHFSPRLPLLFDLLTMTERSLDSQYVIDQICSIEAQYGHSLSGFVVSNAVASPSTSTLKIQSSVAKPSTSVEATASTTLSSPNKASTTSTPSKSIADHMHKALSLEYIVIALLLLSLLHRHILI